MSRTNIISNRQLLTGIFCFLFSAINAQNPEIDSLKRLTNSQVEVDELAEIQLELAAQYYYLDKDTSIYYSNQVLEMAKTIGNELFEARALKSIGNAHFVTGKLEWAMNYYNKALEAASSAGNLEVESNILVSKASLQVHMGLPDQAIETNERNLEILRTLGDSLGVAELMLDLVDIYQPSGNYQASEKYLDQAEKILAIAGEEGKFHLMTLYRIKGKTFANRDGNYARGTEYLLKALKIAEDLDQLNHQMAILASLGSVYRNSGDPASGETTYRKLVQLHEENGINVNLHRAYQRLARTLQSQDKTIESIHFYRKSIDIAIATKKLINATSTSAQLALVYLMEGEEDSAEYYHHYAKKNFQERNLEMGFASFLNHMGEYSLRTEDYAAAEAYFLQALNVGEQVDYAALELTAEGLHQLYSERGDFQKAYQYSLLKSEVADSVNSRDQIREITRLQSKFESDKEITRKQNEIALLESAQQNANLKVTLLLISIVLVILIAYLITRSQLAKKERKKKELEEIAQFKEAMTGMIAHDLKNPLSVLKSRTNEDAASQEMTCQMLQLVNNMLDVQKFENTEVKLNLSEINLHELVVRSVQQVEPMSREKQLNMLVEIGNDLGTRGDYDLLYRVFVNLLTNGIKYSPMKGTIRIKATALDERIRISVSDEGKGISKEEIQAIFEPFAQLDPKKSGGVVSTGLGLTFCRLALNAHQSEIEVISEEGKGASFHFDLVAAEVEASELGDSTEITFKMTQEEREAIIATLPALKQYELHQAVEMEEVLEPLANTTSEAVKHWVESVLDAAYAGNETGFEELLADVEG